MVLDSAAPYALHLRCGGALVGENHLASVGGTCQKRGHRCFVLVGILRMALVFQVLAADFQQITCKAIEKVHSISRT